MVFNVVQCNTVTTRQLEVWYEKENEKKIRLNTVEYVNYTALPWQKEPTDIFGKIELLLGNGQGWWYLPNKLKKIQLL